MIIWRNIFIPLGICVLNIRPWPTSDKFSFIVDMLAVMISVCDNVHSAHKTQLYMYIITVIHLVGASPWIISDVLWSLLLP